jgi:hypothetical protein
MSNKSAMHSELVKLAEKYGIPIKKTFGEDRLLEILMEAGLEDEAQAIIDAAPEAEPEPVDEDGETIARINREKVMSEEKVTRASERGETVQCLVVVPNVHVQRHQLTNHPNPDKTSVKFKFRERFKAPLATAEYLKARGQVEIIS